MILVPEIIVRFVGERVPRRGTDKIEVSSGSVSEGAWSFPLRLGACYRQNYGRMRLRDAPRSMVGS